MGSVGLDQAAVPPEKLLAFFFKECEREFRFLEQEHGFAYFSGLSEYRKGRWIFTPWQSQQPLSPGGFEASTFYEKDRVTFEISFSGESHVISPRLCYDRVYRLGLEEVLKAARKDYLFRSYTPYASETASVEKAIHALGKTVQKNKALLTQPNPKIIERALTIREKLLEQKIREQFIRDMNEACTAAARAFMNKDYRRAIELFTPYETHLSFAHLKKLDLARRKILSI